MTNSTHPFRFGIQLTQPLPGSTWGETARRAEGQGWSTLMMPDHLGDQMAVVPALAAAAEATSTLRLSALVFGNDYRHPVVLAKEMATLDVISNGRMDLGLGAGWMRTDYDGAGIDYDPPKVRIDRMLESLVIIRGLFADGPVDFAGEHYTLSSLQGFPKPVQSPMPILIGGGGKRMCSIAAREADIVGITANLKSGEIGADAAADVTGERFDEKLTWVKNAAGDRFSDIELNCLVMSTQITDDRAGARGATGALIGLTAEQVAETPVMLIGTTGQIIDDLRARRRRWGFSYVVVQGAELIDAMAPVVAELSGT